MKMMEIIGTLDNSVRVNEDPSLAERGHERDPVIVELPEGADTLEQLSDEGVPRTHHPARRS
jgi:spartin